LVVELDMERNNAILMKLNIRNFIHLITEKQYF